MGGQLMPGTTTDGAPFPLATEQIKDGAAAIQTLAQWMDDQFVQDLRQNRPTFGRPGRTFWATDTFSEFLDTGTAWRRRGVEAGTVVATGTPAAPIGYVAANGATVSRTGQYADLWAAIGGLGGVGDGSITFTIPDLRGRTLIAHGTGPGLTARSAGVPIGEEAHVLTIGEMPSHSHGIDGQSNAAQSGTGSIGALSGFSTTASNGGGGAHNNMQPSIGMYFYFKL